MQHDKLVLVSHPLCPYVQRSLITLDEKHIPHERVYVDLGNKPEWFLSMSPLGKVPLLIVNDTTVLFESAVICEFLDETTPASLHPADPLLKARHRAWIEFGSQLLNDIAKLYGAKTEPAFREGLEIIVSKLRLLEATTGGPYFAGANFSMVDAAYGPVFRYFDVLDCYLPYDVFAGCQRLQAWRQCLASRPSVKAAVTQDYPRLLRSFVLSRGSVLSDRVVTTEQRWATA
jgi:glutathione S-transferase